MIEESRAGSHYQRIYLRVDNHGEGAIALHRQFLVGSVITYHHHLGCWQFIAVHLVDPTLHRGDNLRVLE